MHVAFEEVGPCWNRARMKSTEPAIALEAQRAARCTTILPFREPLGLLAEEPPLVPGAGDSLRRHLRILCQRSGVLIVAGILASVLAVGIAWPWVSMRGIRCELSFAQHRVREGETVAAVLRVQNRFPWPVWGLVLERGLTHQEGDSGQVALARVNGWTSSVFNWDFVPQQRGVYPLATPELATGFPFGLFRAACHASIDRELIVWPHTVPLHSLPDAFEIDPRDERHSDSLVGDAGEVLGTRGFRQGDSLRRIHWPQSARHQRLIVCERQAPATCAVALAVDLESVARMPAMRASLEQVIRVAASVCESLHRLHADVECRIGCDLFRVGGSATGLRRLMDFLARIPRGGTPRKIGQPCASGRIRSRLANPGDDRSNRGQPPRQSTGLYARAVDRRENGTTTGGRIGGSGELRTILGLKLPADAIWPQSCPNAGGRRAMSAEHSSSHGRRMPGNPRLRKLAAAILSPLRIPAPDRSRGRDDRSVAAPTFVTARLHWLTIGLCLLAATAFAVAERERANERQGFAMGAVIQAGVVVLAACGFRRSARRQRDASIVTPILVSVVGLTYLWQPLERWLLDTGKPLEVVVMTGMQNLMLGLAAGACWRKYEQLAGLLSLFLVLFAATFVSSTPVYALIAIYSRRRPCGGWQPRIGTICASLLASEAVDAPRPVAGAIRPWRACCCWGSRGWKAIAFSRRPPACSGHPAEPESTIRLPNRESGTEMRWSPGWKIFRVSRRSKMLLFAPATNRACTTCSTTPTRSRSRSNSRIVPWRSRPNSPRFAKLAWRSRSEPAANSRRFAGAAKHNGPRAGDLQSDALFYVAGRTPLHLRLEIYDLFDGIQWLREPVEETSIPLSVDRVKGRPWIMPHQFPRVLDAISTAESHALKIVNLDTPYIPAPLNLRGVHVDLVETESMFQWSAAGLVRMDRQRLPALVPIHLAWRVLDARAIDRQLSWVSPTEARYSELPVGDRMPAIAELARRWASGRPPRVETDRCDRFCGMRDRIYARPDFSGPGRQRLPGRRFPAGIALRPRLPVRDRGGPLAPHAGIFDSRGKRLLCRPEKN